VTPKKRSEVFGWAAAVAAVLAVGVALYFYHSFFVALETVLLLSFIVFWVFIHEIDFHEFRAVKSPKIAVDDIQEKLKQASQQSKFPDKPLTLLAAFLTHMDEPKSLDFPLQLAQLYLVTCGIANFYLYKMSGEYKRYVRTKTEREIQNQTDAQQPPLLQKHKERIMESTGKFVR
jgi:small-conductance mechanosensitive channel